MYATTWSHSKSFARKKKLMLFCWSGQNLVSYSNIKIWCIVSGYVLRAAALFSAILNNISVYASCPERKFDGTRKPVCHMDRYESYIVPIVLVHISATWKKACHEDVTWLLKTRLSWPWMSSDGRGTPCSVSCLTSSPTPPTASKICAKCSPIPPTESPIYSTTSRKT